MNLNQFLDHHGVQRNPFSEEDAQTDPVFKNHCIFGTHHPTWDKVFGDPAEPATAVVFGEKGSGKTAMRLQISRHLAKWNEDHPRQKVAVIHYDDFNPFLDRFADHVHGRKRPQRVLAAWKLWDHLDAVLCLAVTGLIDRATGVKQRNERVNLDVDEQDLSRLNRYQARDLMLLATCYDQSTAETYKHRWKQLRRLLNFSTWRSYWDVLLGNIWMTVYLILIVTLYRYSWLTSLQPFWLHVLLFLVGWTPWLWRSFYMARLAWRLTRNVRVSNLAGTQVYQVLKRFLIAELASQPLPTRQRSDDRYELLEKLQSLLATWDYQGLIILVDRVDEPHLVNGSPDLMRALIWPMLDNKFLKYPGIGVKLMLPVELLRFVEKEDTEFYQRARLDKQNMVSSFEWTPESLMDVTNARIQACGLADHSPTLRSWIDPAVSDRRLLEALGTLRVPRHVFKFLYRLLVAHCHAHQTDKPVWQIAPELFESTLAVYTQEQLHLDRGLASR